ncbi:MAG: YigZ family protein [Paludibacteraceae bacterium]|nr:YigZ family protein [Paludibacteraceae bacterium]
MTADTYLTITGLSEGLYKDKGSKFLAFAMPVKNEDEAKEMVRQYRKQYHDARHVCYAYMLGAEHNLFRSSDDGEPSGTAGRPILGQINANNLTDILIIVVRYFGGILLGTGGLVVAYREATSDALNQAEIVTRDVMVEMQIKFAYEHQRSVMRLCKEYGVNIIATDYQADSCTLRINVKKVHADAFATRLADMRVCM